LDVNPAKVVALYPVEVSGRLAQPEARWIEMFGEKKAEGATSPSLLDDVEVTKNPTDVATVVDPDKKEPSPTASVHDPETKDDAKAKAEATSMYYTIHVSQSLPIFRAIPRVR
jgi:hypothetical protein